MLKLNRKALQKSLSKQSILNLGKLYPQEKTIHDHQIIDNHSKIGTLSQKSGLQPWQNSVETFTPEFFNEAENDPNFIDTSLTWHDINKKINEITNPGSNFHYIKKYRDNENLTYQTQFDYLLKIYYLMKSRKLPINHFQYKQFLFHAGKTGNVELAFQFYHEAVNYSFRPDCFSYRKSLLESIILCPKDKKLEYFNTYFTFWWQDQRKLLGDESLYTYKDLQMLMFFYGNMLQAANDPNLLEFSKGGRNSKISVEQRKKFRSDVLLAVQDTLPFYKPGYRDPKTLERIFINSEEGLMKTLEDGGAKELDSFSLDSWNTLVKKLESPMEKPDEESPKKALQTI